MLDNLAAPEDAVGTVAELPLAGGSAACARRAGTASRLVFIHGRAFLTGRKTMRPRKVQAGRGIILFRGQLAIVKGDVIAAGLRMCLRICLRAG